ncbi:MAG: TIM barrel protein [Phycisphaeraceae bacterium]|nr:TIM barrel protein [Phycisphaeraceae bacterium]
MFINLRPGAIGIHVSDVRELSALAVRHDYGGIDLTRPCLESDTAAQDARAVVERAGLRWGLFGLPFDVFTDSVSLEKNLPMIEQSARRAAIAGVKRTYSHIWSSHPERDYSTNLAWHAQRLKRVAEVLGRHGIEYGLEFLGPPHLRKRHRHEFIHTLDGMLELLDVADAGGHVGLALDFFHCFVAEVDVSDLRKGLVGRRVVVVHANDAIAGRPIDQQLDHERALPMATGVVDGPGMLRAVAATGFDGPVFAEPFKPEVPRLGELPPDDAAAQVMTCMKRLFAEAGVA